MGVAAADVKSIAGKDHFKSRIPQQSFLLYVTHYNWGPTEIAPKKSHIGTEIRMRTK